MKKDTLKEKAKRMILSDERKKRKWQTATDWLKMEMIKWEMESLR
ncbi:hypothetical protein [Algivirga pacifica]